MSLAAAQAMDDLADCLEEEASSEPIMGALARAHRRAAKRIRARAEGKVTVPAEFKEGQAGSKNRQR
jgi:hypothetical protein